MAIKSSGETFSIADPNEAWIMELIGKGPDQKGIVWVAARVPDGMITAHANLSRITTFPLDDPENWLYSPGRDHIRDREEVLFHGFPEAIQLSRCLSSRHRRFAEAGLRRPRLEHLPPFGEHPRSSPTPSSGGRKGPRTTRSSSSPMRRWAYPK